MDDRAVGAKGGCRQATCQERDAWRLLCTLHGRVTDQLSRLLQQRHGLSLSTFAALSALADADGGTMRMQTLADAIGLDQSSASRLAARLERDGLAERGDCQQDRRGVLVLISDRGRELLADAVPTYLRALAAQLDLAASEPELAPLVARLRGGD
jgi:DNA-binding MarR family transcriptional regulator